ncbi:MAG: hypothetical protein COA57_06815 [Flavobacteriales bacterium]|nr:hypothetical protein [Bacteroidales bacterium AH-315-I05]PCJ85976.1 MAG: hypothetical protein COA57_06815 [Flavobacteriales bacterium]
MKRNGIKWLVFILITGCVISCITGTAKNEANHEHKPSEKTEKPTYNYKPKIPDSARIKQIHQQNIPK